MLGGVVWEIRVNITTSKREHCSVLPGDTEGGDAARRAGDGGVLLGWRRIRRGSCEGLGMGFSLDHLRAGVEARGGRFEVRDDAGYWSCVITVPLLTGGEVRRECGPCPSTTLSPPVRP